MPFVDVSFLVIGSHFFCKNTKKKIVQQRFNLLFFSAISIFYTNLFFYIKKNKFFFLFYIQIYTNLSIFFLILIKKGMTMKIFISWSGDTSHKVAEVLRDWLPGVIQCVKPYVSSEDIDKGTRWSTDIASELNKSNFGILCVTPDNVNAPWLNFEAGALGKSVETSKVCPFLFKIKRSEIQGPILQFQSTIAEKDDVFKLLKSINSSCEDQKIEEPLLERVFNSLWPSLEAELNKIKGNEDDSDAEKKKDHHQNAHIEQILEEVLELSRLNQKLLRKPEEIFPPSYLLEILHENNRRIRSPFYDSGFINDMTHAFYDTSKLFMEMYNDLRPKYDPIESLRESLMNLGSVLKYATNQTEDRRSYMITKDALMGLDMRKKI